MDSDFFDDGGADGWDSGTQFPPYYFANGAQDQFSNQMVSHNELHNPFQGAYYHPRPQMAPHAVVQDSQQMPPMQNAVTVVESQSSFADTNKSTILTTTGCPHEKMMQELDKFTNNMTQFATTMNARITKAEYERDIMRTALHQAGISPPVPQTAPQFGNRHSRYRDANDTRFTTPVTPTKQVPVDIQQPYYSAPSNAKDETAFGTKLAGVKKQKTERTRARKDLKIKVPGKSPCPRNMAGIPTPMSKTGSAHATRTLSFSTPTSIVDTSPLTPGRIGPSAPTSGRSTNSMNGKRKNHNLEKQLPASNALIPLLPLTDTEIIVYFFQSLVRPVVSLRLYARNWGPAHIVDVLNAHRTIAGGYLRNTASVKCTTAIKKGRRRYGDSWAERLRDVFADADDLHATDLMQLRPDEVEAATDFLVRDLTAGLKMHPEEGVDGGVFTRCVKWCVENEAGYTLRNVHELALALRTGVEPLVLETPVQFREGGRMAVGRGAATREMQQQEMVVVEEEESDDDDDDDADDDNQAEEGEAGAEEDESEQTDG
ncbi:hypothetical protein TW65_09266 [Stemphylium lycopersici]|nr:hypothetical protein TW65_09266 [Stemphylium lycopersici]